MSDLDVRIVLNSCYDRVTELLGQCYSVARAVLLSCYMNISVLGPTGNMFCFQLGNESLYELAVVSLLTGEHSSELLLPLSDC